MAYKLLDSARRGCYNTRSSALRFRQIIMNAENSVSSAGRAPGALLRVGLDVGSTTVKVVVPGEDGEMLYASYRRHRSRIRETLADMLEELRAAFPEAEEVMPAVSGSAGIGIAEACNLPFVQEVYAEKIATETLNPGTDAVIELGGEDAKMLFPGPNFDARMNDSCAGGTGAFIDRMAGLLNAQPEELDALAARSTTTYTIASRCGVFAKSDIQPLLNQGAAREDLAAAVFSSVADQAIASLARGRTISGKVLYLGGPLTFQSCLRKSFDDKLHVQGICPPNSLYYVAIGCALCADRPVRLSDLAERVRRVPVRGNTCPYPLFRNAQEYTDFRARHAAHAVPLGSQGEAREAFIGIDSGSTTIKIVLIDAEGHLLDSFYDSNHGNPIPAVRDYLLRLYTRYPQCRLLSGAATGYGEELIRHAFRIPFGVVETVAHFTGARHFLPNVDFILDIGGQDIKCMRIRNGAIDNIFLNEACSSGCGSFLQTFAEQLGYGVEEFARLGLQAGAPVELGSRCTVFMNSSVKQAQRDGAGVADISAGLSRSIVKNALYKVIRPTNRDALGKHIVVQGGTFLNDCVLRAFEQELGLQVIRPNIAGIMGAFGAALYAREQFRLKPEVPAPVGADELQAFCHSTRSAVCGRCTNRCRLTINSFGNGRNYISGNRCERPITHAAPADDLNLCRHKLRMLGELPRRGSDAPLGPIGIPMGLNIYELLPFWQCLLTTLGFQVVTGPMDDRRVFRLGQNSIPDDTVCFPAKMMHGQVRWLAEQGLKHIFYPCMTYNLREEGADNCYNCPVVAYYPEVLAANVPELAELTCHFGYLGLEDRGLLTDRLAAMFRPHFPQIRRRDVKAAVAAAYTAQDNYTQAVRAAGAGILQRAREIGKHIIVLAGRPYHIDPRINHSIDRLITGLGAAVVTEDAVAHLAAGSEDLQVLNQWSYHARLYAAARYVCHHPDTEFVQLVSFGCGCDAITADECRRLLENAGRLYTQIKIDDIENPGAAKIRLRSLLAAAGIPELQH